MNFSKEDVGLQNEILKYIFKTVFLCSKEQEKDQKIIFTYIRTF